MTTSSFVTRLALLATTGVAAASMILPAVSAVAATPAAGTAAPIPAATRAVPRFSPLYMGYQDGTPITQAIADQLARNYDVIAATTRELMPFVASMKAINPKLVIVGYVNGLYATASAGYPEAWYEHDTAGKRVYSSTWNADLMDPSNSSWRANVSSVCQSSLAMNGYDGCFLDNLGEAPFIPNYVTAPPVNTATGAVWTQGDWMPATTGVAQTVVNALPGEVILGNGLMDGPHYFAAGTSTAPLSNSTSAALAEVFLRSATQPATSFPSETSWKQNVDMLTTAESQNQPVLTTTKVWASATAAQVETWHKYTLASFLMGTNGGSYYNFSSASTTAQMSSANPEDAVNPGTAAGAYAKVDGLYQRTFSNGLALVNPTKVPVTVPLAGTYTALDGSTTSGSITLTPNTGDVLTASSTAVGNPAATTGSPTAGGATSETLTGVVNPTGADTNWTVQYGTDASYGSSAAGGTLAAGFGQSPVGATLSGLTPGTTYHYRINASNSSGAGPSSDATFTTPPLSPTVVSAPVGTVTDTTAAFSGTVNPGNGPTTWAIQYGTTMHYGSSGPVGQLAASSTSTNVTGTLSGLAPVTAYHARLTATNSAGTVYGPDRTFKTMPVVPTTTTSAASRMTPISATLNGTINAGGGRTTYVFQYGPTSSYGSVTSTGSAGSSSSPVAVAANLTHLLGNTSYHARLVATNDSGTTNGADITLTTANLAPGVTSPTATYITTTGARVSAALDNEGQATTYAVQYGTTSAYGSTTTAASLTASSAPRTGTIGLSHLAGNTTYHYCVTATNGAGTTTSADHTFTTLS